MPKICTRYAREICKKKLGQNVHHNSGVGAICSPSKILCDLGQNVLGQNVLGAFCLGAFCLFGAKCLPASKGFWKHSKKCGNSRQNISYVNNCCLFVVFIISWVCLLEYSDFLSPPFPFMCFNWRAKGILVGDICGFFFQFQEIDCRRLIEKLMSGV